MSATNKPTAAMRRGFADAIAARHVNTCAAAIRVFAQESPLL
jgi:hypothetical protein